MRHLPRTSLQAESFNPGDHRPACQVPVVAAAQAAKNIKHALQQPLWHAAGACAEQTREVDEGFYHVV